MDDRDIRLKRLRFRSWHRGTREADMLVGGFFDRYSNSWGASEIGWYEMLMDEQDVDILAWALGTATPPVHVAGPMMRAMQRLDFIQIAE